MWVLTGRLEEAKERLGKLQKKAARYGDPFEFAVVETKKEKVGKLFYNYSRIELTHTNSVQVGEHTFIARIEHLPQGNLIDKAVYDYELNPQWREAECQCDHCGVYRVRNFTYLVRSEADGALVQVGRTCLRDYLGTDTPESVLHRFQFLRELKEMEDEEMAFSFGGGATQYNAEEVLAVTRAAIKLWGWVSVAKSDEMNTATAYRIDCYWALKSTPDKVLLEAALCEDDYHFARSAIEWFLKNGHEDDYSHNVRMVLSDNWIDPRRRPLACSAVAVYASHLDRQREAANPAATASEHVGTVGARLRSIKLTVTKRTAFDSVWGHGVRLTLRDDAGNVFTAVSKALDYSYEGDVLVMDASVKQHTSWKGTKQTELTRATLLEVVK